MFCIIKRLAVSEAHFVTFFSYTTQYDHMDCEVFNKMKYSRNFKKTVDFLLEPDISFEKTFWHIIDV